jgi:hypothetical protein
MMNQYEQNGLKEFGQTLEKSFGLTAEQRSGKDYMGFTWFEIFKHGKTTGNSFNAVDEAHAIRMYNQLSK